MVRFPRSRRRYAIPVALGLALVAAPALEAQDIDFSGQLRTRAEYRDPGSAAAIEFTGMRARLGARAEWSDGLWAFIQLQDVRIWGEELSTTDRMADGLDLHQGFVQFGAEDARRSLRIGRFEQSYGGERLIGALGWANQGRAFDGVRARLASEGGTRLDAFAWQISEEAAAPSGAEEALIGLHLDRTFAFGTTAEVHLLHSERTGAAAADRRLVTAGARAHGSGTVFDWRLEGSIQRGERAGRDVEAWMLGARLGGEIVDERLSLTLWYDHLSGGDPADTEDRAFDTLFGTNHKFYGYADLFLDPRSQTQGRGLSDLALKAHLTPAGDWRGEIAVHRMEVVEDTGLPGADLGWEVDLIASRSLRPGVGLTAGFAVFLAGDALLPVRGIDGDTRWGFLMLDVRF